MKIRAGQNIDTIYKNLIVDYHKDKEILSGGRYIHADTRPIHWTRCDSTHVTSHPNAQAVHSSRIHNELVLVIAIPTALNQSAGARTAPGWLQRNE